MSDAVGARLLALPPSVAAERPLGALEDVRDFCDPDGVWIPGPRRLPRAPACARRVFDVPVVHPPLGAGTDAVQVHDLGGVSVVTVQRAAALDAAGQVLAEAAESADAIVLVCDEIGTAVRPTALEATLQGARGVAEIVPDGRAELTVLTGSQSADYDLLWTVDPRNGRALDVSEPTERDGLPADEDEAVRLRVIGTGSVGGYGGGGTIATYALAPGGDGAGRVADPVRDVDVIDADAFGLRAVSGIGPKTAERLAARDVTSRDDVRELAVEDLAELPGVGPMTASRMRRHAAVLETGDPLVTTDDSIPAADRPRGPLCIDIETDGLSPTVIWQVGVYDPETDDYRAFVERRDPSDPGRILESFLDRLLGLRGNRALLTWNGWGFDYRYLSAFVDRYVPHYASEWESIPKLDLYLWCVTDGNAILPGRTNRLDDVAAALGYEDAATGLDGAATAAAYRRFVRTGVEPDWDRHERYCEDDCRALWHVYERLLDAERAIDEPEPTPAGQTGLGEF
ncbi:ribonuclease H-like domain-containing protein [Halovivax sp.]|uniref:ribonuclease H-like domain-containing protein n=1 Tax=Halovivax sp. TaxID=1935978 RepID=UPI0025C4504E|nr:ribonuclease H-like domain-containing protein [Halovivax sp.]